MRHAGMFLSRDNRWFVATSMAYLIASALWLAWQGTPIADPPLRIAGVHLFTAGFVLSLIYGLGAHMLPRFTGNPIAMGRLPWIQLGTLNFGLPLFVFGAATGMRAAVLVGGALIWLSHAVFAWRVWRVLWPRAAYARNQTGNRCEKPDMEFKR
jgi:hypothetical protein